jgi:hypothetical protein
MMELEVVSEVASDLARSDAAGVASVIHEIEPLEAGDAEEDAAFAGVHAPVAADRAEASDDGSEDDEFDEFDDDEDDEDSDDFAVRVADERSRRGPA